MSLFFSIVYGISVFGCLALLMYGINEDSGFFGEQTGKSSFYKGIYFREGKYMIPPMLVFVAGFSFFPCINTIVLAVFITWLIIPVSEHKK